MYKTVGIICFAQVFHVTGFGFVGLSCFFTSVSVLPNSADLVFSRVYNIFISSPQVRLHVLWAISLHCSVHCGVLMGRSSPESCSEGEQIAEE